MKKILALISAFIMLFCMLSFAEEVNQPSASGGSSDSFSIAKGLGLIEGVNENDIVTLSGLYKAVKVFTGIDTVLNDEEALSFASIEDISKEIVVLLNCEIMKNDDNTYQNVLNKLGVFKGVLVSQNISYKEFSRILANALEENLMETVISSTANNYSKSDETLLNRYFDASLYEMTVKEVSQNSKYIRVNIDNISDNKNVCGFSQGTVTTLTCDDEMLSSSYENIKIKAFVTKDKKILYWYVKEVDNVINSYISAVNGSERKNGSYYGKYIKDIKLNDKKYALSSDCYISYDNMAAKNISKVYYGRYARAYLENGNIIRLDVFNLSEGGLITGVAENEISLTTGMGLTKKIRNLDDFSTICVYIDGKTSNYDSLKPDMLADYYKDNDYLLIIADSYKVSGMLNSVGENQFIELSSSRYDVSPDYKEYYSNENGEFIGVSDYNKLLNRYCDVYFDYKGNVRYIKLSFNATEETDKEFYAYLTGITAENSSFDDSIYKLRFYKLERNKCDEFIAETNDKVKLPKTLSDMQSTLNKRKDVSNAVVVQDNLYIIRMDENGVITSIKSSKTEKELFVSEAFTHLGFNAKRGFIPTEVSGLFSRWNADSTRAYALTIVDGKTKLVPVALSGTLTGERYGTFRIMYAVSEMASVADISILFSDVDGEYGDDGIIRVHESLRGICIGVNKVYDENKKESLNRFVILGDDGKQFNIDAPDESEFAHHLKEGLLFSYTEIMYGEYPIYLAQGYGSFTRSLDKMVKIDLYDQTQYDMSGDYTDYIDSQINSGTDISNINVITDKSKMYKETIYSLSDSRIWFMPKNMYGVNLNDNVKVFKVNLQGKSFETKSLSDLSNGDEIRFYFNSSSEIDYIFILD